MAMFGWLPAPLGRPMSTFGVNWAMSVDDWIPWARSMSADSTWMAIGTFCRFSLRLWAVTTISPIAVAPLAPALSAVAARAPPAIGAAPIKAVIAVLATAARRIGKSLVASIVIPPLMAGHSLMPGGHC